MAGAAALALSPVLVHAESLEIWVAPGFYGVAESDCRQSAAPHAAPKLTNIDERLCSVFNVAGQKDFSAHFARQMSDQFGRLIVAKPGASLPASVTMEQRMRSTLVASLQISRADIWEVDKSNGSIEVHLPNTVSLLLTNVATGEVVFTQTRSLIPRGLTVRTDVAHYAQKQLPEQIRANISELVRESAQQFRPYALKAAVQGSFDGKYVIDKGRLAGVRSGDRFGGDIEVLFADADYAIVEPERGDDLKIGTVLEKQNVQPAEYLSKHSAMVVMGAAPPSMSPAYLKQSFEEKLGETNVFNITPVNPSLQVLRTVAAAAAGSNIHNNVRKPPEYFVYVQSFITEPTQASTNIPTVTLNTVEAYSLADIVDRSGRVLFSRVASERIVDEVVDGISFPNDQRQDTAVRNSLEKLAGLIEAEFKPRSLRLSIDRVGEDSIALDPSGLLTEGTNGVALRNVGRFGTIKGQVWAPVDGLIRVEINDDRAVLKGYRPSDPPRKGDVFAVDGGGNQSGSSRRAFSVCAAPNGLPSGDLSGSPLIRAIGSSIFAQKAGVPFYPEELAPLSRPLLKAFENSGDQLGIVRTRTADVCVKPIFRFSDLGSAKSPPKFEAKRYSITVGFTLHDATGERLSGSGVQAELTTSPLPMSTPPDQVNRALSREFVFQMNRIAPTTITKLVIP